MKISEKNDKHSHPQNSHTNTEYCLGLTPRTISHKLIRQPNTKIPENTSRYRRSNSKNNNPNQRKDTSKQKLRNDRCTNTKREDIHISAAARSIKQYQIYQNDGDSVHGLTGSKRNMFYCGNLAKKPVLENNRKIINYCQNAVVTSRKSNLNLNLNLNTNTNIDQNKLDQDKQNQRNNSYNYPKTKIHESISPESSLHKDSYTKSTYIYKQQRQTFYTNLPTQRQQKPYTYPSQRQRSNSQRFKRTSSNSSSKHHFKTKLQTKQSQEQIQLRIDQFPNNISLNYIKNIPQKQKDRIILALQKKYKSKIYQLNKIIQQYQLTIIEKDKEILRLTNIVNLCFVQQNQHQKKEKGSEKEYDDNVSISGHVVKYIGGENQQDISTSGFIQTKINFNQERYGFQSILTSSLLRQPEIPVKVSLLTNPSPNSDQNKFDSKHQQNSVYRYIIPELQQLKIPDNASNSSNHSNNNNNNIESLLEHNLAQIQKSVSGFISQLSIDTDNQKLLRSLQQAIKYKDIQIAMLKRMKYNVKQDFINKEREVKCLRVQLKDVKKQLAMMSKGKENILKSQRNCGRNFGIGQDQDTEFTLEISNQ